MRRNSDHYPQKYLQSWISYRKAALDAGSPWEPRLRAQKALLGPQQSMRSKGLNQGTPPPNLAELLPVLSPQGQGRDWSSAVSVKWVTVGILSLKEYHKVLIHATVLSLAHATAVGQTRIGHMLKYM